MSDRQSLPRSPVWTSAASAFGAAGFALAQPLFSILSESGPFFVAHDAGPLDLVIIAALLGLALPLLAAVPVLLAAVFGRRFAHAAAAVLVGLCAGLLAAQALRPLQGLPAWAAMVAAAAGAGAAALAYRAHAAVARFTRLLAPAALVFPVLFLAGVEIRPLVLPEPVEPAPAAAAGPSFPVVLVVFDELPVLSLMTGEGALDELRFPLFGRLAKEGWWFRNATTVAQSTPYAVPAILAGRYPHRGEVRMPIWRQYKRNLFRLLAPTHAMHVLESASSLCPARICPPPPDRPSRGERLSAMLADIGAVALHLVTPTSLAGDLPQVDLAWRDFWASEPAAEPTPQSTEERRSERRRLLQRRQEHPMVLFDDFLAAMDSFPRSTLHFVHLMFPHLPWHYLPDGTAYAIRQRAPHGLTNQYWTGSAWEVAQAWQSHLLQVGAADTMLGRLIDRLESLDLYDDCLLVVTADHGTSFVPADLRRNVRRSNLPGIANVPLFVKLPGQRAGGVDDRNVETVDILPLILAELDETAPRNRLDPRPPRLVVAAREEKRIFTSGLHGSGAGAPLVFGVEELVRRRAGELRRQAALFGSGTWESVFEAALPPELAGRRVEQLAVEAADTAIRLELDPPPAGPRPESLAVLTAGTLHGGEKTERPLRLAVAVDGVVAAATETYEAGGETRFTALLDPQLLRRGPGRLQVFELIDGASPSLVPIAPVETRGAG